jgi:hypothetical protein
MAIDELSRKMGRLEEELSKMRISQGKKVELFSMIYIGNAYEYCKRISERQERILREAGLIK